jgi:hypothetical protein
MSANMSVNLETVILCAVGIHKVTSRLSSTFPPQGMMSSHVRATLKPNGHVVAGSFP